LGDVSVERCDAFADIYDEENEGCAVGGDGDLVFDVLGQIVAVFDTVTAGVDEFVISALDVANGADAVASDTGCWFNDADPAARNAIEQRAFAHVWPAYDSDDG
jgi:hypothetical protein